MNWLQRLCQTKPMALPYEITEEHTKDFPGGWRPPGITRIDRLMTQETSDRELGRDPNIEFFDAGRHGIANRSKDLIRKWVHTKQEAANAYEAMTNPRPFVFFVKNVEKIQNQPDMWAVESEEIEILSRQEAEITSEIINELIDNNRIVDESELIASGFNPQVVERIFSPYMKFLEDIDDDPLFDWSDAWGDNLGRTSDGRIVLLDLGGANTDEMSTELPPELQLVQLMS